MRTILSGVTILPFVLLLLLAGCQKEEEPPPVIRPVLFEAVSIKLIKPPSFAGMVQPQVQTALGFRVAGLVVARDVDTGDVIKTGQLLAALDPNALELAERSAQADLANAQATLANASSVEKRTRALLKSGTETQASLETAEQSRQSAEASLIQARASLAKAQEQVSYAKIIASYDGVVTDTDAEVGQVVAAGASVVTVARPDARDAVVDMPENEVGLPIGTPFIVALQINPSLTVKGKVREIAPLADSATRTRRVKIALENPPESFRLGTTIAASVMKPADERLIVPSTSVLVRDGKSYVWVIDKKAATVARQEVATGAVEGTGIVISSGLEPGTLIVTAGVHSLKDGQKVKIEDGVQS